MSFYAFALDSIDTIFQRGKLSDFDVITFCILVNQVVRAKAVGSTPAVTGGFIALGSVGIASGSANVQKGFQRSWVAGPLSIAPGDQINICYSGTNTSDEVGQLSAQQQAEVEIKILDTVVSAVAGAVTGPIGAAITAVLGFIGDPIGKFLGFHKEGPCNGGVFSDAVGFTDTALANLAYESRLDVDVPDAKVVSFTKPDQGHYTDEAFAHDTSVCGHIAESVVHFSVYQVSAMSWRFYGGRRFGLRTLIEGGMRQLASAPFTMRSLLLV